MSVPRSKAEIGISVKDLLQRVTGVHDEIAVKWTYTLPRAASKAVVDRLGSANPGASDTVAACYDGMKTEAILAEAVERATSALDTALVHIQAIESAAQATALIEEDRW